MARASKATLNLTLISLNVRLTKATDDPDASTAMKTVCVGVDEPHDPTAITAPFSCATCGNLPHRNHPALKKGLPNDAGTFTLVSAEEVAEALEADLKFKGLVDLAPFDAASVNTLTIQGGNQYIVECDAGSIPQYKLIVHAVESHPEWAFLAEYTPRSRAGLYVMRVRDGVLLMEERIRTEHLRALPQLDGDFHEASADMLDSYLQSVVVSFDPEAYRDRYAAALKELTADREGITLGETATATDVVAAPSGDLFTQLTALAASAKKKPARKRPAKKKAAAA